MEPLTAIGRTRLTPGARYYLMAIRSDTDDCLLWPFAKTPDGYGNLLLAGKRGRAHAFACQQAHGAPPTRDHEVAHSCHHPACINPKHLRWATRLENQHDRLKNNTSNRGERSGHSKLTEAQVHEIRRGAATGQSYADLGKQFCVSETQIAKICRGTKWSWLITEGCPAQRPRRVIREQRYEQA